MHPVESIMDVRADGWRFPAYSLIISRAPFLAASRRRLSSALVIFDCMIVCFKTNYALCFICYHGVCKNIQHGYLFMASIVEMKALRTSNVEIAGFVKMSGYDGPKTTT